MHRKSYEAYCTKNVDLYNIIFMSAQIELNGDFNVFNVNFQAERQ